MAAITEIYVDPSIAGDSGAGLIGDPYGDLEWAVEQATFDTTNGTRVNILAGTDEILAADLGVAIASTSPTPAWVPSGVAPLIFQGYTAAAGDGGKGGISGGGSVAILTTTPPNLTQFVDLHMHNTGSAAILDMVGTYNYMRRCELNNSSHILPIQFGNNSIILGCYIHGLTHSTPTHININTGDIHFCHVVIDSGVAGIGIRGNSASALNISRCIVELLGAAGGGIQTRDLGSVMNCSVFSHGAGVGIGISLGSAAFRTGSLIANNLVEGFSGTSGNGIEVLADRINSVIGNAVFNCETPYALGDVIELGWGSSTDSNETLSASPFADASASDFSPVDTGAVKEGSIPDKFGER